MTAKKKAPKKIKSLPAKSVSAKDAKSVKGGGIHVFKRKN
jgi:hypothetical protein